jgi:hypothetical protein
LVIKSLRAREMKEASDEYADLTAKLLVQLP